MAWVDERIAGAMIAPAPPGTGPALVRYAGGRRALTEQISGMSGPPKKSAYDSPEAWKVASTRWRTASRRAQRADDAGKAGKQVRGQSKGVRLSSAESRRVRGAATRRKLDVIERRGFRVRFTATVAVKSPTAGRANDVRLRTMPAGGPGALITSPEADEILDAIRDGDTVTAGGLLLDAFWEAYGMPEDTQILDVRALSIWPEGAAEPG